ncbi:MAG TPA: type I-E CRISPR-associated protein Cas7/Cse4/CasC [Armatimonadota bacterium]|jgi:CRISPR system Cascade subunit CasC
MIVELHILQNFAPSCLNRDDTNSPKDCEFGGYRRARISSQCLKRSTRWHPSFRAVIDCEVGLRTKRLVERLSELLIEAGHSSEEVALIVPAAVEHFVGQVGEDNKTKVLLYLGRDEIERMKGMLEEHWPALVAATGASGTAAEAQPGKKGKKSDAKSALGTALEGLKFTSGTRTPDIALFGRMVAEKPEQKIDAACQVAHAISTHRVRMEMDFYTAVDDLPSEDTAGAGMMGTVEFNSACFYRYALVNVDDLVGNLDGDRELALRTVDAFLRASVAAIPTGKQNSMAAQNPPSFILAVVRDKGLPCSLANAFLKPVRVAEYGEAESLVGNSLKAFDDYWGRLATMYGSQGIAAQPVCWTEEVSLEHLGGERVASTENLYGAVQKALQAGGGA